MRRGSRAQRSWGSASGLCGSPQEVAAPVPGGGAQGPPEDGMFPPVCHALGMKLWQRQVEVRGC